MIEMTPEAKRLANLFRPPPRPIVASNTPQQRVTARMDIDTEGSCPYCKRGMRKVYSTVDGSPDGRLLTWLCDFDRHVAPVRNGS